MSKVCFITHEFYPQRGGIATYLAESAAAAGRLGWEVSVWHTCNGKVTTPSSEELPGGVHYHKLPYRGTQGWWSLRNLRLHLQKENYPWSESGLVLGEPGPLKLWLTAKPVCLPQPKYLSVILHGSEANMILNSPRLLRRFRTLAESAYSIGVVSQWLGDHLCSELPEIRDKLVRVPGAIPDRWCHTELPTLPKKTDEYIRILCVARVHPRKGQWELVDAISHLPEAIKRRVILKLVGPVRRNGYARRVRRHAKDLGVNLGFEGIIADEALCRLYRESDLLVMPSRSYRASVEGLGLVFLEAGFFGIPSIGTRHGGIPEAIQDERTGLLVEPEDPLSLARAIQRLVIDEGLREQLGAAAREFVLNEFSWERNIRKLLPG